MSLARTWWASFVGPPYNLNNRTALDASSSFTTVRTVSAEGASNEMFSNNFVGQAFQPDTARCQAGKPDLQTRNASRGPNPPKEVA